MTKPYKLKLTKLEFLSSCDVPAQGAGGAALLLKRNSDEFTLTAKVTKTSDDLGLVFGYAFASSLDGGKTGHVDSQNDVIDPDFLKTVTEFIEAGGQTDVNHDFATDGKIVFAWPLLPEVNEAMGIKSDVVGLAVAVKPSAETYKRFQSKELTGFSIAGTGIREPLTKSARVIKGTLCTDEVDGHAHTITICEDGSMWCNGATAAGAEWSHSHCVMLEGGELVLLADSGHTHSIADGQAVVVVQPETMVLVSASAKSTVTGKSTQSKSTRSIEPRNPVSKDTTMPTEQEKQIADLTAKLAKAERLATLTDAQRSHYSKLGADGDAYLAKSFADREAVVAEIEKANEVVYTSASTGETFRKSDDPRLVAMAKRQDEQAMEIAKRDEAIEKAEIRKQAAELFGKSAGSDDVHDLIVRSLKKSGAKAEEITAAFEALKALAANTKLGKSAPGAGGTDPQPDDPAAELDTLTMKYMTDHKVDRPTARVEVLKTAEGKRAYAKSVGRA